MERKRRTILFNAEEQKFFNRDEREQMGASPELDFEVARRKAESCRHLARELYEFSLALRVEEDPHSQFVGVGMEHRAQELNRFAIDIENIIPEVFAEARQQAMQQRRQEAEG